MARELHGDRTVVNFSEEGEAEGGEDGEENEDEAEDEAAEESEAKENKDGGDGEEGADDGACPVCLEALTASKQQVMLPRCKHRMCDECFAQLVAMARGRRAVQPLGGSPPLQCPLCRGQQLVRAAEVGAAKPSQAITHNRHRACWAQGAQRSPPTRIGWVHAAQRAGPWLPKFNQAPQAPPSVSGMSGVSQGIVWHHWGVL